jgi:flagellar motor switch protein FliM
MTELPHGKIASDVIGRIMGRLGQAQPSQESISAADYDWRQCHHYAPAAVAQLKEAMTKAGGAIADKLTDLFHARPEITVDALEQCFAGEALARACTGESWVINLNRQKGKGCGVLAIGGAAAAKWVAQMLGDDSSKRDAANELSELEQTLLMDITFAVSQAFVQSMAAARGAAMAPDTQLSRGANIELDALADACRITLGIKTANDSSAMDIVLLCDVLDPVVGMDLSAAGVAPEKVKALMLECIKPSPVVISTRLGGASVRIKDIADLKSGDVIVLSRYIDEPVEVFINGRPLCAGQLAEYEGRYAVVASETYATAAK